MCDQVMDGVVPLSLLGKIVMRFGGKKMNFFAIHLVIVLMSDVIAEIAYKNLDLF